MNQSTTKPVSQVVPAVGGPSGVQSCPLPGGSPELDRITRTATRVFNVPMALVTLLDDDWQWFASKVGMAMDRTPRDQAFCAHAILLPAPMVVPDARLDPRFADNPLVTRDPFVRFYAGHTVRSRQGVPLGTLCVLDTRPRTFSESDRQALADLAVMVEKQLHLREADTEAAQARTALAQRQALLSRVVDHAGVGIALLDGEGRILESNRYFESLTGRPASALQGRPFTELLDLRDRDQGCQALDVVGGADPAGPAHELRFRHPDGNVTWAQLGFSILPDSEGSGEHSIVVATDIDTLRRTQFDLQDLQRQLEERVRARTAELEASAAALGVETARRDNAQSALVAEREHFRRVLENTSDAFVEIDGEDRILTWNGSARRIFGWSADEALGRCFGELTVPPPLRTRHARWLQQLRDSGYSTRMKQRIETQGQRRNGEEFPMEMTFSTSQEGDRLMVHGFLVDISQRKVDEAALRETMRRLRTITDNVPAMIAHIGADLCYRFHNRTYFHWFDLPPQGLVGRHLRTFWGDALFDKMRPDIERVLAGEHLTVEYMLPARQGTMWFHGNFVPHTDDEGRSDGFYLLAQDITERKRLYERIEHEASHDPLTGLANRRGLMQRLTEAMARARRHGRALGVMFMDLDDFKHMNDTLGHDYGDAVLQRFAADIAASVRETDFVCRLAGDEFVVVLEDLPALPDALIATGEVILERINAQADVLGIPVGLASSIGAVTYDGSRDETPAQLLARADGAMYEAKSGGKNRMVVL